MLRKGWLIPAATVLLGGCAAASKGETGSATTSSADGVPISYEVKGDGSKTLVFVHGWSCDRSYWRYQLDSFPNYRVIAIDLAGHGASGSNRTAWNIENFARDVAAVLEDAEADNAVIIGHSLGGPVALEAARLVPGRVIGVIGVDAFFDSWADPENAKFAAKLREDFPANTRGFVRNGLFLPGSRASLADSVAADMARAPPEIALAALDSLLVWAKDRQDREAASVEAPAGLIMVADGKRMTRRFQQARQGKPDLGVEELAGSGHFLMLELPAAFNEQLRRMIGEL